MMAKENKIRISESDIRMMVTECTMRLLKEDVGNSTDEELETLFNYLKQDSTKDIRQMFKREDDKALRQKAYNYFEPKAILHDVWVIHFTNLEGFEGITENGFKYGESNPDKLAYTQGNGFRRKKGKYNFALLLDSPYLNSYDLGYGDCAIVFKTDGVLAYHKIDGDDEVIFLNNNIKSNLYGLIFDEDTNAWYYDGKKCGSLKKALNNIKLQQNC